ncbi:ATP/GTP-binding protein [Paractinoplanes deccanensis]|uniref:ATP/GTP-binding protein n=1 Tax=Paractinoplanes deccanensis TaxID=113561 RepID=A0ABQ3YF40_9ACTN|nr:tetratricopeptide repeat protein [Actinoplanes deccanensis]GID78550.1 ATP/GTP-binding protein [Actinoplanes deccanensis]
MRWWRLSLLVAAGVVGALATTVGAVAVNVATGGTARPLPWVERHPWQWSVGAAIAVAAAGMVGYFAQRWYDRGSARHAPVKQRPLAAATVSGPPALPSVTPPWGLRSMPLRGRDEALAALDCDPSGVGGTVTVLHGIGGVGKTRLALEIGHRAAEKGVLVWWIDVPDAAALEAGIRAVGYAAGATQDDFAKSHPADASWRALNRLGVRWLLVIDNADDPAVMARERPLAEGRGWIRAPRAPGTVIITSRDGRPDGWAEWIVSYSLRPLSPEASAAVLLDLAESAGNTDHAMRLGERLSGIPLLLHLAGSALRRAGDLPARWSSSATVRTFDDYESALQTNVGSALGLDELYQRTWEISVDQLTRTGLPHARTLLLLACCFADAPLPYEDMFDPDVLRASELLSTITPGELLRAVRGLEELGLVMTAPTGIEGRVAETALLYLHPVVRTAGRAHPELANESGPYWRLAVDLLIAVADRADASRSGTQIWAQISDHAAATLAIDSLQRTKGARRVADRDLSRRVSVLRSGSRRLAQNGWDAKSLIVYDALLRLQRERYGDRHAAVLTTRNERAGVLRAMGRHEEALDELDVVLAVLTDAHGRHHRDVLTARDNRARLLREIGRHGEAMDEFHQLVAAVTNEYGDHHEYTLTVRHERARTSLELERYDDAIAEFDDILAISRSLGESHHFSVLITRHERARALLELKRYDDALAEFDDILAASRSLQEPHRSSVLITRHERARALVEMKRYDDAITEFDDILRIAGDAGTNDRDLLLTVRSSRARAKAAMGRRSEALAELDAIVEALRRTPAASGDQTLAIRVERAKVLHALGQEDAAASEIEAVARERAKRLGADHPRTRWSMTLAESFRNGGGPGSCPE